MQENRSRKHFARVGYILIGCSIVAWGMVFVVPFVLESSLAGWMSGLYGVSYVFWFGGIACLGRAQKKDTPSV